MTDENSANPGRARGSPAAALADAPPDLSALEFASSPERGALHSLPPPLPVPGSSRSPEPLLDAADDDSQPERDRIVVLGRRQSGKTIFLASIYHKLWKSVDGLTAKALSGEIHKQLINTHLLLQKGEWPSSTLGTSQIDLELEYHGKRRLLVALDYAGELFSKAFVDERNDWPGVKELKSHIDRAAAVLLLVDPVVVAGADSQAAMDDDFGLVQAVQRIRNWPGGEDVPVVLVLTKCDQNQTLLDRAGGPLEFARKHFRALLRALKELPIIQISAIQTEVDKATGKRKPRADSTPINIDSPLRYCLCALEKTEETAQQRQAAEDRQQAAARAARQRSEIIAREQRLALWSAAAISVVGTALVGLILFFRI